MVTIFKALEKYASSKTNFIRNIVISYSPDRKKAKKDYERSSRHESRDKKVETEHLDDLEEEIPSWIRCSSSDAQFNKANMVFYSSVRFSQIILFILFNIRIYIHIYFFSSLSIPLLCLMYSLNA